MKFLIAPKWFMELKDDDLLNSKQVMEMFLFPDSTSIRGLIDRGAVPYPDSSERVGKKSLHYWRVGYLKNFMKLPHEINQNYVRKR